MPTSRPGYVYMASDFGDREVELQRLFRLQMEDARNYFLRIIKPRLDRSYKLYISYGGDRQREIKRWQANIFVPYIQAVVETLVPRILDARPDFGVSARTEENQAKCEKQQQLIDYLWEISGMDNTSEDFVRACLIYGTAFLQVSWKKDSRKLQFLETKDVASTKYTWKEREQVFYDAPYCEWIDNYNLWYDWHNTDRKSKQFWFKRLVLTKEEIERRYPNADRQRLALAFAAPGGDLVDYAAIRQSVRTAHTSVVKGAEAGMWQSSAGAPYGTDKYYSTQDNTLKMYEVFEWYRPFQDTYAVMVGGSRVPIFKGGYMPIPFDFKEVPFIETTYLKIPGEFEGYGIPLILENPQVMLNLIKNQRLDAATLSIHKMWVVNPLANINKEELVTRPFGIIYSIDPNGVREIQFSDIKASAYKEEDTLKSDMRYASGVDDFSMGAGGDASSATEVRHLRESTLERVRIFVNHLGSSYSDVMRYWMSLERQLFTKEMTIRIIGDDGKDLYPLIQKDDLRGEFDYKATVLPSISGQADIRKKQDMDLFQLLVNLPFIDPRKLTSKVLADWDWSFDAVATQQQDQPQVGPDGQPMQPGMGGGDPSQMGAIPGGMPPGGPGMPPLGGAPGGMPPMGGGGMPPGMPGMGGGPGMPPTPGGQSSFQGKIIPPSIAQGAMALLRKPQQVGYPTASGFTQAGSPINLLQGGGLPPTAPSSRQTLPKSRIVKKPGPQGNSRGHNRTGKVNTNISSRPGPGIEANLMNQASSLQR